MDHRDPRAVLGLPLDTTREEAQRAFRRLARQTHPDAGGEAADFRLVAAAWAKLGPLLAAERRPPPVVAPHLAAYRPASSRILWAERRPPVRPAGRDFALVLETETARLAA